MTCSPKIKACYCIVQGRALGYLTPFFQRSLLFISRQSLLETRIRPKSYRHTMASVLSWVMQNRFGGHFFSLWLVTILKFKGGTENESEVIGSCARRGSPRSFLGRLRLFSTGGQR